MSKPIVFWGATGQAIVLEEFLHRLGFELVALFDNDASRRSPFPGVPLHHGRDGFHAWAKSLSGRDSVFCTVAVGGGRGEDRLEIQAFLRDAGLRPQTLVHPDASVARDAEIGAGCQLLARTVVGPRVQMGDACIVNSGAIVEHECRLGHGVHVAPGAILTGCVTVEDHAFVGAGAVVLPRLRIGRGAVVGAGAVVTEDVESRSVVAGVPAKPSAARGAAKPGSP